LNEKTGDAMNIKQFQFSALLMIFVASIAQGSEAGKNELSRQMLLNPKGELFLLKRVWEDSLLDSAICTGSVVQDLPVIGECPDEPGYVKSVFQPTHRNLIYPENLL
jgi:hypothetical protein